MILFPTGIIISVVEHQCLLHVEASPEQWLQNILAEKARLRKEALINEWRPRLFANPSINQLPADADKLVSLIITQSDYKNRLQNDAAQVPPIPLYRHNTNKFNTRPHSGVTLFLGGIKIADTDANCILAYIQDLEDWILGALLGQINRGKKKMLQEWQPLLFADPNVQNIPASEEGMLNLILNRPDYKPLVNRSK